MQRMTFFSFLAFLILLFLLPFFFTQVMAASLMKLHLSPQVALGLTIAIIFGGLINIPIARLRHGEEAILDPLAIFGVTKVMRRVRHETIIAINLGGAIIPTGLAIYEFVHLGSLEGAQRAALIVSLVSVVLSYVSARVVPGLGIAMPGFLAAATAAIGALLLAPESAAPVAFIAGVMGPLVGADLLHLRDIKASPTGIASIGGAGTFDGIVLSGIIAAYLT